MREGNWRVLPWLDLNKKRPVYGLECLHDGVWHKVAQCGQALFYELEYDACARVLAESEE